jgi:hypothetical protein
MFTIDVKVDAAIMELDRIQEKARRAADAAVHEATTGIAMPAMRSALSFKGKKAPVGQLGSRTGLLVRQLEAKFFTRLSGEPSASIRVRGTEGKRNIIAAWHEKGTRSHGRYGVKRRAGKSRDQLRRAAARRGTSPLPARAMFGTVFKAIQSQLEALLKTSFERHFQSENQ